MSWHRVSVVHVTKRKENDLVQVERGRHGGAIVYSYVCDSAVELWWWWEELGFDGCIVLPYSVDAMIAVARKCLTWSNVGSRLFALD